MDQRVARTIRKMKEAAGSTATDLTALANDLNISVSRLRHIFRRDVGISPCKYQKLLRLAKLRSLMRESNLRVKEAVAAAGLSDFSHAVRDYKAIYKENPSDTREDTTGNKVLPRSW
jgi:transcriptional regulator GlxA family with amidase domain